MNKRVKRRRRQNNIGSKLALTGLAATPLLATGAIMAARRRAPSDITVKYRQIQNIRQAEALLKAVRKGRVKSSSISFQSMVDELYKIAGARAPVVNKPKHPRGLCPGDIHDLADSKGIPWDNDDKFMAQCAKLTGVYHLDKMDQQQLKTVYKYLSEKK